MLACLCLCLCLCGSNINSPSQRSERDTSPSYQQYSPLFLHNPIDTLPEPLLVLYNTGSRFAHIITSNLIKQSLYLEHCYNCYNISTMSDSTTADHTVFPPDSNSSVNTNSVSATTNDAMQNAKNTVANSMVCCSCSNILH